MKNHILFSAVLAAGSSTRFGTTKQLAKLDDKPLVAHALETAREVTGHRTLLVTGHEWRAVVDACTANGCLFLYNENFRDGMSSSIAAAARAVAGIADGLLLVLADQVAIDATHLREIESRWRADARSIVASRYAGVLGPPVIFPSRCFEQLLDLEGDRGARQLLAAPGADVIGLDNESAGIDVDTPEQLKAFSQRQ